MTKKLILMHNNIFANVSNLQIGDGWIRIRTAMVAVQANTFMCNFIMDKFTGIPGASYLFFLFLFIPFTTSHLLQLGCICFVLNINYLQY